MRWQDCGGFPTTPNLGACRSRSNCGPASQTDYRAPHIRLHWRAIACRFSKTRGSDRLTDRRTIDSGPVRQTSKRPTFKTFGWLPPLLPLLAASRTRCYGRKRLVSIIEAACRTTKRSAVQPEHTIFKRVVAHTYRNRPAVRTDGLADREVAEFTTRAHNEDQGEEVR